MTFSYISYFNNYSDIPILSLCITDQCLAVQFTLVYYRFLSDDVPSRRSRYEHCRRASVQEKKEWPLKALHLFFTVERERWSTAGWLSWSERCVRDKSQVLMLSFPKKGLRRVRNRLKMSVSCLPGRWRRESRLKAMLEKWDFLLQFVPFPQRHTVELCDGHPEQVLKLLWSKVPLRDEKTQTDDSLRVNTWI